MKPVVFVFAIFALVLEHHGSLQGGELSVDKPNGEIEPKIAQGRTFNSETDDEPKIAQGKANISSENSGEYFSGEDEEEIMSDFSFDVYVEDELPISTSAQEYYGEPVSKENKSSFNDRKKPVVAVQNWQYIKEEKRRMKAVALFRNHALELIDAAVQPIRNNSAISKQAKSCAAIIKNTKAFATIGLILQTILIVDKHWRTLPKIANADSDLEARKCVKDKNLMSSIEKIVDLCLLAEKDFALNSLESILKDHLENINPDPSYLSKWTSWFDYDEQSATNCFHLMVSIDFKPNKEFFEKFLEGFSIVSQNMRRDAKVITAIIEDEKKIAEKRRRLTDIENEIKKLKLETPNENFRKKDIDDFCLILNARNNMEYDKKIDSVKNKFVWLGLFFLVVYTAKGIAWLYR